ncbi:MAG: hypothetical protein U0670_08310 [Anaerolineae bacterium]
MKRLLFFCLLIGFLVGCSVSVPTVMPRSTNPPSAPPYITPVALVLTPVATSQPLPSLPPLIGSQSSKPLAVQGNRLIVVNPDSDSISLVNTTSNWFEAEIPLGGSPRTVAVRPSSPMAFVTLWDRNALSVVDLTNQQAHLIESVCHIPFGVVANERRAFVSCFADDSIAILDAETGEVLHRVTVPDAPAGLALSGSWLLITHFYTGTVTVLNVERTPFVVGSLNVDTDGELARTIIPSPDGLHAYIPQTRTGLALISLQFMQDWFPVVSVLDVTHMTGERSARLTLSTFDEPANLPSDAAFSPDGNQLYVTLQGSDALMVLDPRTSQLIARIPVGTAPLGVWATESALYVLNALDGTVSVLDPLTNSVTSTIPVTTIPLDPILLRGKTLFYRASDPRLSDGAVSCATCHFEGGADGRSWINFRSGARNTPALGGSNLLPPFNWAGDMAELHDTIEDQIRSVMLGDGLIAGDFDPTTPALDAGRSADLDALAAYVASLEPWPSPYRFADGSLSESAQRGMQLFMSGSPGCGCHTPPLYTDQRTHNLTGAAFSMETVVTFDTPSLRGLWATAPYLHDGIARSLPELFSRGDPVHDIAGSLSPQQLDDLIAFLLSL